MCQPEVKIVTAVTVGDNQIVESLICVSLVTIV